MLDLSISLSLSLQLPLFIHLFTHSYHQSVCVEHLPCTRPWAGYCLAVPVQIHFTLFPALFCVQEAHHHGLCHPGSLELCRLPAGNLEVEGEEVGQFTLSCCSLPALHAAGSPSFVEHSSSSQGVWDTAPSSCPMRPGGLGSLGGPHPALLVPLALPHFRAWSLCSVPFQYSLEYAICRSVGL